MTLDQGTQKHVPRSKSEPKVASNMETVDMSQRYNFLRELSSSKFGTVCLVEDKWAKAKICLKVFTKSEVKIADFNREYQISYFLSPHPNVLDTYPGIYCTTDSYFFVQEVYGTTLRTVVESTKSGLNEADATQVLQQVADALEFLHDRHFVHTSLSPANILVYDKSFSKVKISDFSNTRLVGTVVRNCAVVTTPWEAPEMCELLEKERYTVESALDVWAFGIISYYVLNRKYPWMKASITSRNYWEWEQWIKKKTILPVKWTKFTDKALKMFKRTLHPKAKERCSMAKAKRYLRDKWIKNMKVSEPVFAESFLLTIGGVLFTGDVQRSDMQDRSE
ncbi:unnamed protein product [Soboliphyme baturini]|uniref:Protein kinase domain-containing protein n=1 Tax=Soboliphyme baturini TaxID=241478 RepID=A0A183INS3_9BILA|nr:unnamed protein product [Soboliphyme baturini]